MRHVVVRRTALSLGATLLSGAVLFAWLVSPRQVEAPVSPLPLAAEPASEPPPRATVPPEAAAPPPPDGDALFRSYCRSCHSPGSLRLDRSRGELEVFLRDHGKASDAEDRVILDFLAGGARGAGR